MVILPGKVMNPLPGMVVRVSEAALYSSPVGYLSGPDALLQVHPGCAVLLHVTRSKSRKGQRMCKCQYCRPQIQSSQCI